MVKSNRLTLRKENCQGHLNFVLTPLEASGNPLSDYVRRKNIQFLEMCRRLEGKTGELMLTSRPKMPWAHSRKRETHDACIGIIIQTTYQQQHRNNFDTEPKSLVYAPSSLSKDLYPNVNTSVLTILRIMLVSTPTPVRSFSTTRRVKTYLRSIMSTACLSPTVLIHPYRVFPNDTQREVVTWDPC